jgi:hypothetical protein
MFSRRFSVGVSLRLIHARIRAIRQRPMIHVATMIQATGMRSSMTGSLRGYYTLEPYEPFSAPHLLATAKLLLFQADLFVRGWLITPRSHASRSREEPESFNAGEAHRLTFAPRVFFLEVVRVE